MGKSMRIPGTGVVEEARGDTRGSERYTQGKEQSPHSHARRRQSHSLLHQKRRQRHLSPAAGTRVRPSSLVFVVVVACTSVRFDRLEMPKKLRVPKTISLKDDRIKKSQSRKAEADRMKRYRGKKAEFGGKKKSTENPLGQPIQHQQQLASTTMFFHYNQNLGPPFYILCDTNFIIFSIRNKMDIVKSLMDCLLAKCVPLVTDCVVAELQQLGAKYRLALRLIHDNFERLTCMHKGTYADDCITNRVIEHKCYIVGTCDKALKRRLRKIPGVPIMYISQHQYTIERMPDAYGCTK